MPRTAGDAGYVAALRTALVALDSPAARAARRAPAERWRVGRSRGRRTYGVYEQQGADQALVVAVLTDPVDQRGRADLESAVRHARERAGLVEVCMLARGGEGEWLAPLSFATVGRPGI